VNSKDSGVTALANAEDRSIGDILAEVKDLSADQVEQVLDHQRANGMRFGEAAVALGLVSSDDVLYALSQQFRYPYAPGEQRQLSPELVVLNEPFSVRAEHFRALRSQLMMRVFPGGKGELPLAVISPDSGDGRTYCAANLAVALAQLGGRTLLIDADLRNPRLHELFRVDNRAGLSSVLSGRTDSQLISQIRDVPSLYLLPVGTTPPNPLELLERQAFGLLLRELASKFDHVIVDTPSARIASDALVIAARCGSALMVARKHVTRLHAMEDLTGSLVGTTAKLAGVVVNEF
jgi:chain length determinant protein tyrosine kinase EpsG